MGYHIELNSLLVIPDQHIGLHALQSGDTYTITKDGERLYPVNIPIEICDHNYNYYGKVVIRKLTLQPGSTTIHFKVVKVFDPEEAAVYSRNFIPNEQANGL